MTRDEKIQMLRIITGEQDGDILSTYLYIASQKVLHTAFPYDDSVTEVPAKYVDVELQIATYLINKRGAEGESRHTENGIDRTYSSADIPSELIRRIVPSVGVM